MVLIVDDDIRTVFALAHVLGRVGMTVRFARTAESVLRHWSGTQMSR